MSPPGAHSVQRAAWFRALVCVKRSHLTVHTIMPCCQCCPVTTTCTAVPVTACRRAPSNACCQDLGSSCAVPTCCGCCCYCSPLFQIRLQLPHSMQKRCLFLPECCSCRRSFVCCHSCRQGQALLDRPAEAFSRDVAIDVSKLSKFCPLQDITTIASSTARGPHPHRTAIHPHPSIHLNQPALLPSTPPRPETSSHLL
jgi:hypothetical protein